MWQRKGNFMRETETFLIAALNNAIRINHIKARIDKEQQSSWCKLCSDRDETINQIISERSKLVRKKYKTRHYWVGKVIHRIVQEIEIWPYDRMVYAQPIICPGKWDD